MTTSRLRLAVTSVAVVLSVASLHLLGAQLDLGLASWPTWNDQPVHTAIGILRLVALALSYYLLVVLVAVWVLGDRLEENRFARFIPTGTLSALGLVAAVSAASVTATTPSLDAAPDQEQPLVLHQDVDPLTLDAMSDANAVRSAPLPPAAAETTEVLDNSIDARWIVQPGDSFWTIAEETLGESWGTSDLTDAEIVSYWRPLIEANRDRLVDPSNADLLMPDQEIVLPPTPDLPAKR